MRTLCILAALAGVSEAQETRRVPWRTDVAVARAEARKNGKPCALFVRPDAPPGKVGPRNFEQDLEGAPELIEAAARIVLIAVRSDNAALPALAAEFGIPRDLPVVIVLDGTGALLGGFLAASLFGGGPFGRVPQAVVGRLEDLLKAEETVPGLQKKGAAEELSFRLESMGAFGRSAEVWERAAESKALAPGARKSALQKAWDLRYRELTHVGAPAGTRARLIVTAEQLLVEGQEHVGRTIVSAALVDLLENSFDFPARYAATRSRLRKATAAAGNPPKLRKTLKGIFERLDDAVENLLVERDFPAETGTDGELERARNAALSGRAEPVLRFFSRPEFSSVPLYAEWIEEAKAKLKKR